MTPVERLAYYLHEANMARPAQEMFPRVARKAYTCKRCGRTYYRRHQSTGYCNQSARCRETT
jgi:DNA replicative helicase MCM subunit Mcm2 (Cdc46/Mcm family)